MPADLKGPKVKYKLHYRRCTGPLFRETPAAVTTNKVRGICSECHIIFTSGMFSQQLVVASLVVQALVSR